MLVVVGCWLPLAPGSAGAFWGINHRNAKRAPAHEPLSSPTHQHHKQVININFAACIRRGLSGNDHQFNPQAASDERAAMSDFADIHQSSEEDGGHAGKGVRWQVTGDG